MLNSETTLLSCSSPTTLHIPLLEQFKCTLVLRKRAVARGEAGYESEGVGVLVAVDSSAAQAAFAVKIQRARQLVSLLADHGRVRHGHKSFGVAVAENDPSFRGAQQRARRAADSVGD